MKSIELQKGAVIALMLSSISMQALNSAAFARGGGGCRGGGGWSRGGAAFMRPSYNRFNGERPNFGQHMRSTEAPRGFEHGGFGGGGRGVSDRGDMGQHQFSAAAERSSYVQDFNWGKSNYLAKAPVAKTVTANPIAKSAPANSKSPFGKDHPRRNEVWDRDKSLSNKIQDDKGDLGGHYGQLKREDSLIKKQEQIDARLHDGHITPFEKRRLNREENKLARQIKGGDHGKFPHSLPNQPGPKANAPNSNAFGSGKTGMTPTAAPTTGSAATSKTNNGLTPTSSLPSAQSLPQLSNAGVSSTTPNAGTSGTSGAAGSTGNAAPLVQSAGGLASSLPIMSPAMVSGNDDQQSDDPNDQENTDDSNYPTNNATR